MVGTLLLFLLNWSFEFVSINKLLSVYIVMEVFIDTCGDGQENTWDINFFHFNMEVIFSYLLMIS